jgi:hypothetical protein
MEAMQGRYWKQHWPTIEDLVNDANFRFMSDGSETHIALEHAEGLSLVAGLAPETIRWIIKSEVMKSPFFPSGREHRAVIAIAARHGNKLRVDTANLKNDGSGLDTILGPDPNDFDGLGLNIRYYGTYDLTGFTNPAPLTSKYRAYIEQQIGRIIEWPREEEIARGWVEAGVESTPDGYWWHYYSHDRMLGGRIILSGDNCAPELKVALDVFLETGRPLMLKRQQQLLNLILLECRLG